ncbi:MAG: T9SS type A sorting domain-containing protein, partial [Bacteroidetes bacterium]|nr:T9SS type A sorting domain-containing protein [Bacteroidota bacterium]
VEENAVNVVEFDRDNLAAGIYVYKLTTNSGIIFDKLMIMN